MAMLREGFRDPHDKHRLFSTETGHSGVSKPPDSAKPLYFPTKRLPDILNFMDNSEKVYSLHGAPQDNLPQKSPTEETPPKKVVVDWLKKIISVLLMLLGILGLTGIACIIIYVAKGSSDPTEFFKPVKEPKSVFENLVNRKGSNSIFAKDEVINVLLLGIDRRNKSQTGFNTDIMILASINTTTNKVLLTSVPRDLWINGNKINALYTVFGPDTLVNAFEQITGQEVKGYIRCDFEDFRWIVDSFGGVPVNVERTFTDHTFPNSSDTGVLTVTFTQGYEKMDGNRALTFARSRKGNNGEGSDLMRAKRQHLLLQGLVEAVSQPESIFWPMDVDKFFSAVTAANKMYTTLTVDDAYYFWDFYKDRDDYSVESFVIGDEYVYHPGMYPTSQYHAWVFVPRGGDWSDLHEDIEIKLALAPPRPEDMGDEPHKVTTDNKTESAPGEL